MFPSCRLFQVTDIELMQSVKSTRSVLLSEGIDMHDLISIELVKLPPIARKK